jgi:hypothetical protein
MFMSRGKAGSKAYQTSVGHALGVESIRSQHLAIISRVVRGSNWKHQVLRLALKSGFLEVDHIPFCAEWHP